MKTTAILNERAQRFLEMFLEGDAIDVASYHSRFAPELTERSACRDLDLLVRQGYLTVRGSRRGLRYERTAKS